MVQQQIQLRVPPRKAGRVEVVKQAAVAWGSTWGVGQETMRGCLPCHHLMGGICLSSASRMKKELLRAYEYMRKMLQFFRERRGATLTWDSPR